MKTRLCRHLLDLKRVLNTCLYDSVKKFIQKLFQKKPGKAKGKKTDHETVYKFTERQVILGETDHLDDLTYDPIIL